MKRCCGRPGSASLWIRQASAPLLYRAEVGAQVILSVISPSFLLRPQFMHRTEPEITCAHYFIDSAPLNEEYMCT